MLQGEHSAILSNFVELPFFIKIFVLSSFECPLYTGLTVVYLKKVFAHIEKLKWNSLNYQVYETTVFTWSYIEDLTWVLMFIDFIKWVEEKR